MPGPQSANPKVVAARLKITQSRARRHSLDFKDTHSPCYLFDSARVVGGDKKKLGSGRCVPITWRASSHWGRRGVPLLRHGGPFPTDSEKHTIHFPPLTAILLGPIHLFSITSRLVTSIPDSEPHTDSPHRPLPSSHGGAAEHGIVNRRSQLSHFQSRSKERSTVWRFRLSHLIPGAWYFLSTRQRF